MSHPTELDRPAIAITGDVVSFFVHGQPVPQGSTRAFMPNGHSRPIITSAAKGLGAWRRLIADVAQPHARMFAGPVAVTVAFVLPRPKSLPKRRVTPHTKRPDLDKLIRAVLDALTGVMFTDDAQVSSIVASKRYAVIEGAVGVRISLWEDVAPAAVASRPQPPGPSSEAS